MEEQEAMEAASQAANEDAPMASPSPPLTSAPSGATSQEATSGQEEEPETPDNPLEVGPKPFPDYSAAKTGLTCLPQRAALLKSMLNFLKKAIQDQALSDSIRHVMDGSLPNSLKHIISNAEYYGPSLFLLATDVVTNYVFQVIIIPFLGADCAQRARPPPYFTLMGCGKMKASQICHKIL